MDAVADLAGEAETLFGLGEGEGAVADDLPSGDEVKGGDLGEGGRGERGSQSKNDGTKGHGEFRVGRDGCLLSLSNLMTE
jgi:hypothetical protein